MKKYLCSLLLIGSSFFANAQGYTDTLTCLHNNIGVYVTDTYTLCDTLPQGNFNITIEPTPNNSWQIGKTTKFGNSSIHDTACAIMTDTLNTYPINNISAFSILLPLRQDNPWGFNYYFSFWHKFETDSLKDGCWLEFSDDSGMNWHVLDSFDNQKIYETCNLYNNDTATTSKDTIEGGMKAWSGNSNGWRYTSIHFNVAIPFKPSRGFYINAVRFVFKSDSIDTQKQGWIIDDFNIGDVDEGSGVNDISQNKLPIYPNPSTGIFEISFPSNFVKGTIEVFDINGKKILNTSLTQQIDLSNYPNGLYYYKAFFDAKGYSGVLNKNK